MGQLRMILLSLYGLWGLLTVGAALPLIWRKIGPNRLYGFRVPRTLNDPAVWYEANAFAGRCLLLTGLFTTVAAVALFSVPGISPATFALGCLAIITVGLAGTVLLSFRFLDRLDRSTHAAQASDEPPAGSKTAP